MLSSPRSDLHPPCISRTFLAGGFGTRLVLADSNPNDLPAPNGAPFAGPVPGTTPSLINHLPSSIFVVAATTQVFAYSDAYGNVNTITFAAGYVGDLPFTASAIETTTTCASVTVSWQPGT